MDQQAPWPTAASSLSTAMQRCCSSNALPSNRVMAALDSGIRPLRRPRFLVGTGGAF